jgi:clan AA aspartic protease (TIGR02281 family)
MAALLGTTVTLAAHAGDPLATLVPLSVHATGTYYIAGGLKGHEGVVDFLVDTGSSFLVINEKILEALQKSGTATFSRNIGGSMADGSRKVIPVYKLTGLKIGDGCWINDVEAAVFPGSTRPILGMSVLTRLSPFTMSAEPASLTVKGCATEPIEEVAAETPSAAPIKAR